MSVAPSPVAFHTGVSDPISHAIRLVRKALTLRSKVLLIGRPEAVRELDEQLWTADPSSFIAHAMWEDGQSDSVLLRQSPVWLWSAPESMAPMTAPTPADVLINLGQAVPANARDYAKVIEVVPSGPEARAHGQQRWRCWREWGITPAHHAFS